MSVLEETWNTGKATKMSVLEETWNTGNGDVCWKKPETQAMEMSVLWETWNTGNEDVSVVRNLKLRQ